MSHLLSLDELLSSFTLHPLADDRFSADNVSLGGAVVFGGQILAQTLLAAGTAAEGMTTKTMHTAFLRGASRDARMEYDVESVHTGRTFATTVVTAHQSGRVCARSQVLSSVDEPDVIRHAVDMPPVGTPPHPTPSPNDRHRDGGSDGDSDWELLIVGDVDVDDPDAVGPAELSVWSRFRGAPDDHRIDEALLAFATDGFLIGTAMRPHAGVGQSQAHVSLATSVISHTLTFHEPAPAGDWLLLHNTSPYAGRGRSFGRADVFTAGGLLVGSVSQDALIRQMPSPSA